MGNCEIANASTDDEFIQKEISTQYHTMVKREMSQLGDDLFTRKIQLYEYCALLESSEEISKSNNEEISKLILIIQEINSLQESLENLTSELENPNTNYKPFQNLKKNAQFLLNPLLTSEKNPHN